MALTMELSKASSMVAWMVAYSAGEMVVQMAALRAALRAGRMVALRVKTMDIESVLSTEHETVAR